MSKNLRRVLTVSFVVSLTMPALAQAPSQGSGLVVGAQFTSTQLSNGYPNDPAFGGRMTYFFSPLLGLEAQVDFFPRFERNVMAGGRKIQALFGPRIGSRWHSIGLFAKIRPGFVRYEEGQWKPGILCVAIYPPPAGCVDPQTRLAFDAGGIIEVYPWSRGIVRVDLGTLFVRSNAKSIQHPSTTTRDLQVSAGVTWRIF